MTEEVYIKLLKKITVVGKNDILLKDVAQVSAPDDIKNKLSQTCVLRIKERESKTYLVSIIDIINQLTKNASNIAISNVGEMEVLIEYHSTQKKISRGMEYLKVIIACTILFSGATVAIIAYQTDTSLGKTFTLINKIFTGKTEANPRLITIPYSIGIPVGTLVFYNHLGKKKITNDPTPIQVEINKYETDVEQTIVKIISKQERGDQ